MACQMVWLICWDGMEEMAWLGFQSHSSLSAGGGGCATAPSMHPFPPPSLLTRRVFSPSSKLKPPPIAGSGLVGMLSQIKAAAPQAD